MDICFIFGVPGALLAPVRDEHRQKAATEIGELVLRALESPGEEEAASVVGDIQASGVRLLCDPDLDELVTYVWSGGRMHDLHAVSDKDLRETLDSVEREVVSRWKASHPGYEWETACA